MKHLPVGILLAAPLLAVASHPEVRDERFTLHQVAQHPQVVTPVSIDASRKGIPTWIESHTHFPPEDYVLSEHDRILQWIDDKVHVFYEGTRATMSLKWDRRGGLLLACRDRILQVHDTDRDGRADSEQELVRLETEATYPHNGLCGLEVTKGGWIYFGMGENFGRPYTLIGKDGTRIVGQGDGGQVFRMLWNGTGLERVATGMWNPFGLCATLNGQLWVTDNDPDASPPNRLLEIHEGADYGFAFRWGRAGTHPLQAWDGEWPGTTGMVGGVGEAACEIIEIRNPNWPEEWQGSLLVASWGDHRIELLSPRMDGGVNLEVLVQGGRDFRPVGLTMDQYGRVWITDWVDRSYQVHGKGRLWRLDPPEQRFSPLNTGRADLTPAWKNAGPLGSFMQERWKRMREEQASPEKSAVMERLKEGLDSDDPDLRGFALRWAAETRTAAVLPQIEALIQRPDNPPWLFHGALAAHEWIVHGKKGVPVKRLRQLVDSGPTPALRALAARTLPENAERFAPAAVEEAFAEAPVQLQREYLAAVARRPDRDPEWLRRVAEDPALPESVRTEATLALGDYPAPSSDTAEWEIGRRLFHSASKGNCVSCHVIDGRGGAVGPDLTRRFLDRERLRYSIDDPSAEMAPHFRTLVYTLQDGNVITGIKRALQDQLTYTHDRLVQADGSEIQVPQVDIFRREVAPVSMMPPALWAGWTEAEREALLTFLLEGRAPSRPPAR